MNKHKLNNPQAKNYPTLFSTAGKAWASALERLPRKYGWNSSGHTKRSVTSELNHHSSAGRRSGPLGRALPTLNGRWFSSSQRSAFTIIEVVLVLAIAGLIFLMVFVALPALQRSQRDAQRKNDITRLKTALDSYKANNRGQLPWTKPWSYSDWETIEPTDSFMVSYMKSDKGEFKSHEGEDYDLHITSNANVGWMPSVLIPSLHVTSGTKCAADGSRMLGAGPNSYTVQQKLESGGHICVDG